MITRKKQYIYGIRPLIEAIKSKKEFDKIYIKKNFNSKGIKKIIYLLNKENIYFKYVPERKINSIVNKSHQGVLAYISPIRFFKIKNFFPYLYEKGEVPLILILDRINDVRNFGAIVRTAYCAKVHAIIISKNFSASINFDSIKTSCGAIFKIPICKENCLSKAVKFLKESGVVLLSLDNNNNNNNFLYQENLTLPIGLILGNENNGISSEILSISDKIIKIPVYGDISSLNVSVSCGISLYEVIRQRENY